MAQETAVVEDVVGMGVMVGMVTVVGVIITTTATAMVVATAIMAIHPTGGGSSGSNGGRFPTNSYRKKSDTPSPRKYDPARPDVSKKPDAPTPHKPDVSKTPDDRKGIDNNKKPDIDKKPDTPKRNPEREKIVVDFDKSKEKGTSENDLVNNLGGVLKSMLPIF